MKTFKQFISETTYRRKGWLNINSGKMILFAFRGASIRPFHDEYVANNADKFIRGGEKVLLRKFADANGFAPEDQETMDMWNDIKDGKIDRDVNLDSILEEEGWRRVLFDEGISAVEPRNRQEAKKMVQMILDKIPWSKIESLLVYDTGTLSGGTDIYSEEDAITYAKTGRVPRRTDIGNTMAMFRGESIMEAGWKAIGYIVGPNGRWFKIDELTHSDWVNKHYKKIGVEKKGKSRVFVEDAIRQNAVRIVFRENVLQLLCREGALTPKVRKALGDLYEKETYGAKVWIYAADEEDGGDYDVEEHLLHNFSDPDDAMQFFERGKVVKRSNIGRTMAMFR